MDPPAPPNPFAAPQRYVPYPPPVAARRPLSGFAVAALVTGLLGLAPAAVAFGVVALVRIPRRRQRGRVAAWLGIGLALLWLVATGLTAWFLLARAGPQRDAAGAVVRSGTVLPNGLRAGDCVRDVGTDQQGGPVGPVLAVPCPGPHGGEVFASFDLPAGGWPGSDPARAAAEEGCSARYARAGRQDVASDIWFLYPTGATQWRLGDRRVVCLVAPQPR